jgi:hypothetical protein
MKVAIVFVLAGAAACGGGGDDSEQGLSCEEAIGHFYGVSCSFFDATTSPVTPVPQAEALTMCNQFDNDTPEQCRQKFEEWKLCLTYVENAAQCATCTQEIDALRACN